MDSTHEIQIKQCEFIAERRGNRFLAASDYASPSTVDDEHLDENGHRFLAGAIIKKIEEMRIA